MHKSSDIPDKIVSNRRITASIYHQSAIQPTRWFAIAYLLLHLRSNPMGLLFVPDRSEGMWSEGRR